MSLGNQKETAAVVGVALAGSATAALFGLYLAKRNQRATRKATLNCACKKVQVEIYQPAANYKYAESGNMQCACNDCMGYCQAVLKEGSTDDAFRKGFFDPAVPTIIFYDSEISVTSGKENLEHMKLSRKTENRRVFAKCCGTPIAICPDHSHLNLVYSNLINPAKDCSAENSEVPFPADVLHSATMLVYAKNMAEGVLEEAKTKHPRMKIISTVVAPIEILKMISRLLLLLPVGARGPGDGFPVGPGKEIGIGYDSIPQKMKA